jgi:5-(carboxyamino)imidazole ribonucleotide mutase
MTGRVAILMGSDSDLKLMKEASEALSVFGIDSELHVLSAHRTPEQAFVFAKNAHQKFDCLICGTNMAAHLAGAMAANTRIPVIGVPLSGSPLQGMDALLATVQMPRGIPVATVAIDNAYNAGVLAAQILALKYKDVDARLQTFRLDQTQKTIEKDRKLGALGWKKYLETK